jgi:hypothetical protein
MSIIDTTIQRIQTIAKATAIDATHFIVNAPDFPPEDAGILPESIAYIPDGNATAVNATDIKFIANINCDIHFDRAVMRVTYQRIDTFLLDFVQRLGGDPTLASSVSTIVYPVTFTIAPAEWNTIVTQCVSFIIPVKFKLLTPTVTP